MLNVLHFSSVHFSCSVVSNSLRPHESQYARPPGPSPTPGVHSDSRPSSPWCRRAISSSVIPFSSCSQSLPASESFPMSQLFAWGGQSTGASALASFLPKKSQSWSPSEWTGWISLLNVLNQWLFIFGHYSLVAGFHHSEKVGSSRIIDDNIICLFCPKPIYVNSWILRTSQYDRYSSSLGSKTVARQAPLYMGFPRQKYWSGLSFPSPGDLPDPEIEPMSPAWQADSLLLIHLGSPQSPW